MNNIIKLLRTIEKEMPDGYWLYCTGGTIHLMKKNEKGEKAVTGFGEGFDPDFIVESFSIESDGGDW